MDVVPFGLREVKIVPATGSAVSLAAAQTLSFTERIQTAELRGNDKIVSVNSQSEAVEWSLESGGISLAAYAALTGRTAVDAGTTPNRTTTLGGNGGDNFPYVKLYGKALGEGLDDVHCKLYKAKVTSIQGSFQNGGFFVQQCSGIAVDDGTNGVFDFVVNETATALPTT